MFCRAERYLCVQTVVFHVQNLDEVFRLRSNQILSRRGLICTRINCRSRSNREKIAAVIAEFNVIKLEPSLRLSGEFDGRNLTRFLYIFDIKDAFIDSLPLNDPRGNMNQR